MAHDFSVTFSDQNTVWFFGYANGVMYDVFDGQQFDNGVSGSNQGKKLSTKRFLAAIQQLKSDSRATEYLDTERFPNFFREVDKALKTHNPDKPVQVHFS